MPALAPRLATHQPIECERRAGHRAVLVECLERIGRAGRLETAGAAKPWTEQQAVTFDQSHQGALRQAINDRQEVFHTAATSMGLPGARAACNKTSSSERTSSLSAVDVALG